MKRIWTALALIPACLAPAAASDAAPAAQTDGWRVVVAPNFTVFSRMDPGATEDWCQKFNQFLYATGKAIKVDPRTLPPLTLVLFGSRSDFWAIAPILKDNDPLQGVAAFSFSRPWGVIGASCDLGSDENTQRLLFGMGVNWYLEADRHPRPKALSIGLNEVYSTYTVDRDIEIIGRPIRGRTTFLQTAVNHPLGSVGRFLPIEQLLAQTDLSAIQDRHGVPLYYAECWGFAHFLLFSREMSGSHAMDRLLRAFSQRQPPREALAQVFGAGASSLDLKFHNYLEGGDFYEVRRPVERAPPLSATPRVAGPAAVAAVLSRLEASAHHLDVARIHADEAVRLAPDSPGGYEARAVVCDADRQSDAMLEACETAIRLHSRDGLIWTMRAGERVRRASTAADRTPPGEAREAVNDFETAVKLQPSIEDGFRRIATLMGDVSHVTEDDGKFLLYGTMLYPDDGGIEVGRAQWAHRIREDKLALQLLDDALAHPDRLSEKEIERARATRASLAGGAAG